MTNEEIIAGLSRLLDGEAPTAWDEDEALRAAIDRLTPAPGAHSIPRMGPRDAMPSSPEALSAEDVRRYGEAEGIAFQQSKTQPAPSAIEAARAWLAGGWREGGVSYGVLWVFNRALDALETLPEWNSELAKVQAERRAAEEGVERLKVQMLDLDIEYGAKIAKFVENTQRIGVKQETRIAALVTERDHLAELFTTTAQGKRIT
jgi:hypothetical protein